jgi:hypothetical protein
MVNKSLSAFENVVREIQSLHEMKQSDYGREHDPFANIRASEDFDIPAWVGCAVRMNDKMRRIQAAACGSTLKNESLRDSFLDMAVYAIIGVCLVDGQ